MRLFLKSISLGIFISFITGCCCHSHRTGKAGSWEVLFDGKSTAAWRGYNRTNFPAKGWKIENGTLKTIPGGDVVDLITRDEYENFELKLEWRISPGGNSGIMYHVGEGDATPWRTGPEMQILDDTKHKDGHNDLTSAGALYALIAPIDKHLAPVGDWNRVRIIVQSNHVQYWLNGEEVVEYELNSEKLNQLIAKSKFKTEPRFAKLKTGHIALQFHKDEVWFRDIKIRRLPNYGERTI